MIAFTMVQHYFAFQMADLDLTQITQVGSPDQPHIPNRRLIS